MKNLFIITEDEKKRILGLHEDATKRQYLKESITINTADNGTVTATDGTVTINIDSNKTIQQINALIQQKRQTQKVPTPGTVPLQKQAPAPLQNQDVADTNLK